ncbi:MAG: Blue-light-activated protein [Syntrophus sp. PtaU1.Bin208]|nr:MAG: Blue-light-activated protein [Syntrophus sp. PtaU1.Bin208]
MVHGIDLFFALFKNLAIFIALVVIYGYMLVRLKQSQWYNRQMILGASFGIFAIGCMYARIPVFEGVIVDQRNAIVALSGAFGGPLSAVISAALAGGFRAYLGGEGVIGGLTGVILASIAGIGMYRFSGRFNSVPRAAISALLAVIVILPGFLFIRGRDIQTGWELTKEMTVPYGSAIFLGIFLVGLMLHREEKRYEADLLFRESEEKYRELVEGTSDLITSMDKYGNMTFVNHVAEEILGFPPEACVGRPGIEFVHPDDRDRTLDWFKECVAQKTRQAQIEIRHVNARTGKSYAVLWSSAYRFDDSGNFVGVGGIARDVTKIREAEANYKNLFEKMPDGYAVHEVLRDEKGSPGDYRFICINPAMERITGLKAREFVGKTVLEALPDTRRYWFDIYREIALSGKPESFEIHSAELNKDFEVTVYSPAENQFASIFQDITLRKRAEEEKTILEAQLRHVQKMDAIGLLAGGIAHDFNNILMPIIGYVELAMMKLSSDSEIYNDLRRVRESANRAADLTRQILAFSRKQMLEMQVIDLNVVVQDFKKMVKRLIGEDIDLQVFPAPDLYQVSADKGQIEQVLMNLAVNARDAMPSGGQLTIRTANVYLDEACMKQSGDVRPPGHYVMLAVSDTGCGMDEETRQQIFEPFFTTKERGKGTGLGLSTVFGIIKQHGGDIWAYSEPGKGATFEIYLPQAEGESAALVTAPAETPSIHGTETVLVVEDDEAVRRLVCKTLASCGYQVLEARSPNDALRLASENRETLRLLLTDVIMPEMNGRELYNKTADFHPDIKVLFMSGYTDDVIAHHGILEEGIPFLQKPFTVQNLAQRVRQILS